MSKTFNDAVQDFIQFMGEHTSFDDFKDTALTEAMSDIQSDIVDELMDEIESAQLITWEHDSDGDRPNYDNLREWLKDYYLLEKK